MTEGTGIMIGFAIFLIVVYVPAILYFKLGWFKRFYHDVMGWHTPKCKESFDGCNFHAHCKYCGKEIMQDSQGNWFTFGGGSE